MSRRLALAALVLPALVGTAGMSWRAASALGSGDEPRNLAEAAGAGNAAEVLRRLRTGEEPHIVLPVRPEVISSTVQRATALEAAVWGRRIELIRLLQQNGALGDADRERIGCLARDLAADDIAELLLGPNDGCVPQATLNAVLARTSELVAP